MNLDKLRDAKMVTKWRELEKEAFNYHDMDIINITCYPYIKKIGSQYNVVPGFLRDGVYESGLKEGYFDEDGSAYSGRPCDDSLCGCGKAVEELFESWKL